MLIWASFDSFNTLGSVVTHDVPDDELWGEAHADSLGKSTLAEYKIEKTRRSDYGFSAVNHDSNI